MKRVTEYACFSLEGHHHPNEDRWVALRDWNIDTDTERYANGGREKVEPEHDASVGKNNNSESESESESATDESGGNKAAAKKGDVGSKIRNQNLDHNQNGGIRPPSYFAMYDGHGGAMAVEYIIGTLHKNIINHETQQLFYIANDSEVDTEGITKAIMQGFAKTEEEVIGYTKNNNDASGSCAVVVIIVHSHVFVANVGDSRAVVGRRKAGNNSPFVDRRKSGAINRSGGLVTKIENLYMSYKAVALTEDQKATTPSERKRMVKEGGWFYDRRVWGSLAIARSFGDRTLKGPSSGGLPTVVLGENELHLEKKTPRRKKKPADGSGAKSPASAKSPKPDKEKEKGSGGSGEVGLKQVKSDDSLGSEDIEEDGEDGDAEKQQKKKEKKEKRKNQKRQDDGEGEGEREGDTVPPAKQNGDAGADDEKGEDEEGGDGEQQKKKKQKKTRKNGKTKEAGGAAGDNGDTHEGTDEANGKAGDEAGAAAAQPPAKLTAKEKRALKEQEYLAKKRAKKMAKRQKVVRDLVKKKGGCKPGVVIAEPVVKVYELQPKDDFILLATDGLWDVVDNGPVISWVGKQLHNQKGYAAYGLPAPKLVDLCKSLCNKARDKNSYDDITTLIFFLEDV